jgi:hypothetical protein
MVRSPARHRVQEEGSIEAGLELLQLLGAHVDRDDLADPRGTTTVATTRGPAGDGRQHSPEVMGPAACPAELPSG